MGKILSGYSFADQAPALKKGLLGKTILTPNAFKLIYTVPNYVTFVNCNICLLNTNETSSAKINIAISTGNIPTLVDYVEKNIKVSSDDVYLRDNIKLTTNEKVFIMSDVDSVVIRLEGYEETVI
jgi:hypothetical protein